MSKTEGIVLYICMACVAIVALVWMGLTAGWWWRGCAAGQNEGGCCEDGCC